MILEEHSVVSMTQSCPCSKARSIFQQLCNCTTGHTGAKNGRRKKRRTDTDPVSGADAAPGHQINGRPSGRVTAVDQRHLLLLLPVLLFDLLHDEVQEFNSKKGTHHVSPASKLITLVLALLEWYRLYR